jgi:beta-lactamase class A
MTTRRAVLIGSVAAGLGLLRMPRMAAGATPALADEFGRIEAQVGGRLGVSLLDTVNNGRAGHRADERFPLCSTFKLVAAAAVLKRVEQGRESLDRRVVFQKSDLVAYSPVSENRIGGSGMSLAELCAAALNFSDNTAGNLILASIGGPPGFTDFARSIVDDVTRLDRIEPELNEALPGDVRDTTSPAAMVQTLYALLLGDALSESSRQRLASWLLDNKTGDTRIRAGLPAGWRCGDKTGSGERGATNDVAIIYPPDRPPILLAIYLADCTAAASQRNAAHAAVARAAVVAARA